MPNTEDYALVIGISEYAAYDHLKAAVGDAQAFADWLRSPDGGGVPPDNVTVIIKPADMKGNYPIKDDVDSALADMIGGRTRRIGRRFYFYFSGHGCSPSADDLLLLLANSSNYTLARNIGAAQYRKFLHDAALFDELVLIIDCCRDYQNIPTLAQPPFLTGIPKSEESVKVKAFMALGTGYGQYSFVPDDASERSFFTKFLIEGLSKAVNGDGSVTARSLENYVKTRVQAQAKLYGKTQVPEIPIDPNIVFKPGTPGAGLEGRLVSFVIPRDWTRPLELKDGFFKCVRQVDGTEGKFQAVLAPGLYEIIYPADAAPTESRVCQRLRINPTGVSARLTLQPAQDEYDV